jgi:Domain of unknown function (DUF5916)/Carbohydrate family 9 binding domain-like
MSRILFGSFFLLIFFFTNSSAQTIQESKQLHVVKAASPIVIDGLLNDEAWKNAIEVCDFWEKYPTDKIKAKLNTRVKAAYDSKFLYISVVCSDSTNKFVAPSLKRDGSIREADGIVAILDPQNKKSNGFGFSATPFNVQTEYQFGASTMGGNVNTAWDNKWFSAVERSKTAYTVEMAIPFKTLRYDPKITTWGINFIRSDQKNNKFYTWTNVPVQFPGFDLGYLGSLIFDGELPSAKTNMSFIPYIIASTQGSNDPATKTSTDANVGFDAKISLSPSINLDLTVNPNFSQVEVDQQVTNLTRFSINFPERRTFFLENDDIFSDYGSPPFRPFFSRRIGLDKNNSPIPIRAGARISGNLNKNLRIGAFNMQTGRKDDFASQNYSALSLIQRLGVRSSIKGYVLNRSADLNTEEQRKSPLDKFGRNAGLELNLSDASGKLNLYSGYHVSQKPNISNKNSFYQIGGGYFGKEFSTFIDFADFGTNYYADMGFVNRIETESTKTGDLYDLVANNDTTYRAGFKQLFNENTYYIRPQSGNIITHTFTVSNYFNWFQDKSLSDRFHNLEYGITFKNTARVNFNFNLYQDNLRYFFKLPSKRPLDPDTYNYANYGLEVRTDNRKNLLMVSSITLGKYYNADFQQFSTQITVRKQPWLAFSVLTQYNNIVFPEKYGVTRLWLISPKTEVNFSNKMFWTTFYQFNTQRNNFNINSRLQYRYSPMSDLFLVFTDNYFTDPFLKNKNRALVLKLNYWL